MNLTQTVLAEFFNQKPMNDAYSRQVNEGNGNKTPSSYRTVLSVNFLNAGISGELNMQATMQHYVGLYSIS